MRDRKRQRGELIVGGLFSTMCLNAFSSNGFSISLSKRYQRYREHIARLVELEAAAGVRDSATRRS